jgi:transposase
VVSYSQRGAAALPARTPTSAATAPQSRYLSRETGATLKPGLIALIERRYDAIAAEGLTFHGAQPALTKTGKRGRPPRRVGHNLLLRFTTRKADILRFLTDPGVPFIQAFRWYASQRSGTLTCRQPNAVQAHRNAGHQQSDRAGRPDDESPAEDLGQFPLRGGAKDFVTIRSVLSTARKQGWNMLRTLMGDPNRMIEDLRIA